MSDIFLSLGTNVGERLLNIEKAIAELRKIISVVKISYIYETEPWGYIEQDRFLNLCIMGRTDMRPRQLLVAMKEIEEKIGREKSFRWGPRLIDIDILFYDDLVIREDRLELPHRSIEERAFVLIPLLDINPDLIHPVLDKSIRELSDKVSDDGIVRYADQPFVTL